MREGVKDETEREREVFEREGRREGGTWREETAIYKQRFHNDSDPPRFGVVDKVPTYTLL